MKNNSNTNKKIGKYLANMPDRNFLTMSVIIFIIKFDSPFPQ